MRARGSRRLFTPELPNASSPHSPAIRGISDGSQPDPRGRDRTAARLLAGTSEPRSPCTTPFFGVLLQAVALRTSVAAAAPGRPVRTGPPALPACRASPLLLEDAVALDMRGWRRIRGARDPSLLGQTSLLTPENAHARAVGKGADQVSVSLSASQLGRLTLSVRVKLSNLSSLARTTSSVDGHPRRGVTSPSRPLCTVGDQ